MCERPITKASIPATEACTLLISLRQATGVHGTSAGKPVISRPALIG